MRAQDSGCWGRSFLVLHFCCLVPPTFRASVILSKHGLWDRWLLYGTCPSKCWLDHACKSSCEHADVPAFLSLSVFFFYFCFYVSVDSFWRCLCNTMNCRQQIRAIHLCWYKLKIFYKVPMFPGWGNGFHCRKKNPVRCEECSTGKYWLLEWFTGA